VGKLADLVILSDKPLTVERSKLVELKVLATIKESQTVYQAKAQKK
jgi:predicted amidohydrolase YtcJ